MLKIVGAVVGGVVLLVGLYVAGAWLHLYGELERPGPPTQERIPADVVQARTRAQQRGAAALTSSPPAKQILFGDLHVHTTFSTDAFLWSLPMMNGEGAHPLGDACDYARFCSALDFWSINDHAEATTPRKWQTTVDAIRQCNAVAGDATNPDLVSYLGWEWSQVGTTPEDHYGHKNVIFRDLDEGQVPTRAIGAAGVATDGLRGSIGGMPWVTPLLDFPERQRYYDFHEFMDEVREIPSCEAGVASPELPADCYESARTPGDLFEKLGQWGLASMVIPHGNTWGFYSPPGISWDKQLAGTQHDPKQQFLIEIMSGHGNSEEYRDWRAIDVNEAGVISCPEPTPGYLPSCWRAGEIIEARCLEAGESEAECASRAEQTRQLYAESGVAGHHVVQGEEFEEWLDSGQCKDCFRPSFNYRPGTSTQYALAISNFDDPKEPRRFRFGVIASSDNHRARPGTGYKELDRKTTTEAAGARDETWRRRLIPAEEPSAVPVPFDVTDLSRGFGTLEAERQASFFMTGGLAAVHSEGRSRNEIWEAMERKEVYGTSGERILLWFNLLNAERPDGSFGPVAMGGEASLSRSPRFEVRAVGSFKQKPGCPEFTGGAVDAEQLERLCKGECYNPSDERKLITRIEVVRIRPQREPGEPVAGLIEDPWVTFECPPSQAGCTVQFEDPQFAAAGRDTVYYVRAIEEPTPTINAKNLRCTYDAEGNCTRVDPCYGEDFRTERSDACAEASEERAWSSPIFVDAASP